MSPKAAMRQACIAQLFRARIGARPGL